MKVILCVLLLSVAFGCASTGKYQVAGAKITIALEEPRDDGGDIVYESVRLQSTVSGVRMQDFSVIIFDDDGNETLEDGEAVSETRGGPLRHTRKVMIQGLRLPADARNPWLHASVTTNNGVFVDTWPLQP